MFEKYLENVEREQTRVGQIYESIFSSNPIQESLNEGKESGGAIGAGIGGAVLSGNIGGIDGSYKGAKSAEEEPDQQHSKKSSQHDLDEGISKALMGGLIGSAIGAGVGYVGGSRYGDAAVEQMGNDIDSGVEQAISKNNAEIDSKAEQFANNIDTNVDEYAATTKASIDKLANTAKTDIKNNTFMQMLGPEMTGKATDKVNKYANLGHDIVANQAEQLKLNGRGFVDSSATMAKDGLANGFRNTANSMKPAIGNTVKNMAKVTGTGVGASIGGLVGTVAGASMSNSNDDDRKKRHSR